MQTPIEHDSVSQSYLADPEQDGFGLDARDDDDALSVDDALYNEITERRAQLERADILARARAL